EAMLRLEPKSEHAPETHSMNEAERNRYAGVYANGPSRIELKAEEGGLTAVGEGVQAKFARAGEGFLAGDGGQRLVTVAGEIWRIEFVFASGRAFRRVD